MYAQKLPADVLDFLANPYQHANASLDQTNAALFYIGRITAAPNLYWDIESCLAVLEHDPKQVWSSAIFWPWLFPLMELGSTNPSVHPLHGVDVELIHRYPELLNRYERAHKLVSPFL